MKRTASLTTRTGAPHLGERAFPRLMIAPTLLVMAVLTAYPLIFTFFYSFTNYNYLKHANKASDFILFENYIDLLQDGYFRQAVLNTIKFTLLAVVLEVLLGLLVAVLVAMAVYFVACLLLRVKELGYVVVAIMERLRRKKAAG